MLAPDGRLPSIEEDDDINKANDANNNDVVRCKGWLNYARLPFESLSGTSKKQIKKNWTKGKFVTVTRLTF